MWEPISEYPCHNIEKDEDAVKANFRSYWGPRVIAKCGEYYMFVVWLEANMWMTRNPEKFICISDLENPPTEFARIPGEDMVICPGCQELYDEKYGDIK